MPTQREIAAHLDLTHSTVNTLMSELAIDGAVASMDEIRIAYIRKLRAVAAGHRSQSGDDLIHERVLNERADRELKELVLAEKRGQLVNVTQLEPELTHMVVAFRTDVLALPDRIKTDIDALYGIDVDLEVITDHCHDVLRQLARYDPEHPRAAASAGREDGAAVAHDDDAVGAGAPAPEPEGDGAPRPLQPGPDAVGGGYARGA